MNPFDKPFNTWTIEDFQNALKITATKQTIQVEPTLLNVTTHFTDDLVVLERGESTFNIPKQDVIVTVPKVKRIKQPKDITPKDTKYTRMKVFHNELQTFINTLPGKDGKLDVKTIKRAIDKLPQTHPIHVTYRSFLEKCNWNWRQAKLKKWGSVGSFRDLTEFDRIANHMKYMKGYYYEYFYSQKRITGGTFKVYKNYIKVD